MRRCLQIEAASGRFAFPVKTLRSSIRSSGFLSISHKKWLCKLACLLSNQLPFFMYLLTPVWYNSNANLNVLLSRRFLWHLLRILLNGMESDDVGTIEPISGT